VGTILAQLGYRARRSADGKIIGQHVRRMAPSRRYVGSDRGNAPLCPWLASAMNTCESCEIRVAA
jgi:hypothetical protein